MIKKQLMEALQEVDDDMQIRLYTDHGQACMKLTNYGYSYIEEDNYLPDEIESGEEDEYNDPIKIFVLEAL